MSKQIAPSLLAADFARVGEQLKEIESVGVKYLHLDVMDGIFVPSISFGMPVIESLRKNTDMIFDVHMMVIDPERYIEVIKKSGADIITIHVEACKDVVGTLKAIRELGARPAISINPKTPVAELVPFLPYVDMVLIMSVEPGFGGQSFIENSYAKLREIAEIRRENNMDFLIEVDGGVNASNIKAVAECGADILVAGSAVFKNNAGENAKTLMELIG
ncbi:MAG: ribulose-phosphate 3-epimerase [Butyrivibrio sp.]|nr:ribulose-phosphate 3-epimerase [Butyrivibrio sp.]